MTCSITDFVCLTAHCYEVTVGSDGGFKPDTVSNCAGIFTHDSTIGIFDSMDEDTAYFTNEDICANDGNRKSQRLDNLSD